MEHDQIPTPAQRAETAAAAAEAAAELADRTRVAEADGPQRITLAEDVEAENGHPPMRLLSGEEYAAHKEITLEEPVSQETFNRAWEARLALQNEDNFSGMEIPEDLKDQVWDYIQHTFEGKEVSEEDLAQALTTAIEKEAIFFKMINLDEIQRDEEGNPINTFPDGSQNEGDYLDSLANGDPDSEDDNIDPELLAYLRATNRLDLGRDFDREGGNIEALTQEYEGVIGKLRELNISNLDALRANIDQLGDNPTPAQAMQVLRDGQVNPSAVTETTGGNREIRTLWDLLELIMEFVRGGREGSGNTRFSQNADRYGGQNQSLAPGEAVASNQYLNQVIEDLPEGPRKQLLIAAAGDLGKGEGDRQLMAACSRAGGISAGPQPWCMAWVQKILGQVGNGAARTTAWARDGLQMGPSSTSNPQPGDLVVVARGSGGHIGFYLGTDPSGKPIIIGGNQAGDKVSVKVERRSLLGIVNVAG